MDCWEMDPAYILPRSLVATHLYFGMERAAVRLSNLDVSYILVTTSGSKSVVLAKDVRYMERVSRQTVLYLSGARQLSTYKTPAELTASANTNRFLQCHRSFFVNLQYVSTCKSTVLFLNDGTQLPVGRQYVQQTKQGFDDYIAACLSLAYISKAQ